MKVLFAVSDEKISESIIKRYRKEYQEILTYKNVYFYNAILKEIQKNKDYDRIVISEELESFANNNNYDTIDKFIFEKLDSISDEANDSVGKETSIILICTDRRQRGNELLSKLFSIGIYNALIGDDRSLSEVCKLIKNPRTKKEAKNYYKIDSESSSYRAESENEVSEVEIQNILNHFKKLGKSTEKYANSFNTIAAQYTEEQLRIIANCLPAKVKSVLGETSDKYQKLVSNSFGLGVINQNKEDGSNAPKSGLKMNLLENASSKDKITKPIVIPSGIKRARTQNVTDLENNSENTSSSIRVQKKPKSLQDKINRASIDEQERVEALKKQQEIENENITEKPKKISNNLSNVKSNTQTTDYLDEIEDIDVKSKKNQEIEDDFDGDDEVFGKVKPSKEVEKKEKTDIKDNQILDDFDEEDEDDIFGETNTVLDNFDDDEKFDEFETPGVSSKVDVEEEYDDEYEDEDVDFGDFIQDDVDEDLLQEDDVVETPKVESNTVTETEDVDEDVFGDVEADFDDFIEDDTDDMFEEEVEEEEPVQTQKVENKTEIEEEDIFGDIDEIQDFDDFIEDDNEDIFEEEVEEEEQVQTPKVENKTEIEEEDDDQFFADDDVDFDSFIEDDNEDLLEELEETVLPKSVPEEESKVEDEEDIFGDIDDIPDFDDSEDDDIFSDIDEDDVKPQKVEAKNNIEEDEDDIFGDIDDIPGLDDEDIFGDEEDVKTSKIEKKKTVEVEDEDDLFGDIDDIPGLDDLEEDEDEDIFGDEDVKTPKVENKKTVEIEDEDDLFGDIDDIPGLDDLDDEDDLFEDTKDVKSSKVENKTDDSLDEIDDIPGLDDLDDFDEDLFSSTPAKPEVAKNNEEIAPKPVKSNSNNDIESVKPRVDYSMSNLNKLLTKDKKIVNFVGTTKNGTSFLVNNLAKLFSSIGINTAILDMTKNRNSYYIFTNNDESLRKIAYTSFDKLEKGYAEGIKVDKNLTIYTALPSNEKQYTNAEAMLSTLIQNHSLVLVDCDFETDNSFFALCQELYLVQSLDILTMQPLTTFLRDLQVKQILEPEKIRVVINKDIKVRDLTAKAIIGGMSYYKDPGMSVMVELFNKETVQACSIPFEDNTYSKYLEAIVNCEISLSGYSKVFMAKLKNLGEMIYPLNSKPSYASEPINQNYGHQNRFSSNMNNTLNQMKKKY